MAEIFLSYRRADSASATGRIADRLEEHFGTARVFRDHASIAAGDDFAAAIRRAVEASTVVLVVIGPDWVGATLPSGLRRLDDPSDWVRLEIEFAFAANLPIVPVLVEEAVMPTEPQLPESIAALARCQAIELSETRWRYDAERLIQALTTRFAIEAERPLGPEPGGGWLGRAARWGIDVVDLATHPTRMIARRQTGRAIDHIRAFLFLLGSLLAGNLMLLSGLNVHPSPSSIGGAIGGVFAWLLSGELLGLILVTLLAVPLTIGWRLVGQRIEFRQITLIGAYVYSGAWFGLCGGALILGYGLQMTDAGVIDRVVAQLLGASGPSGAPTLLAERTLAAQAELQAAMHGPAVAAWVIALLTWLVTATWTVVAWGSFRRAFGAGRWQAVGATLVWAALIGALLAACLILARA
jgi:hypothetical protein